MHPELKLTAAEYNFLRAWIWEEANSEQVRSVGAKATQVQKAPYAAPALADLVTAAMTPDKQTAIAAGPTPEINPPWPWTSDEQLRARHQEAKQWLERRFSPRHGGARETAQSQP